MKARHVRLSVLAAAVLSVSPLVVEKVNAQAFLNYNGGNYTQNFDGLGHGGSNYSTGNVTSPGSTGPWLVSSIVSVSSSTNANAGSLAGWQITAAAGAMATNSGTGAFRWDDGNNGSGTAMSLGNTNVAAGGITNRALGTLASGTLAPRVGLVLVNNTTNAYNAFSLSYLGKYFRSSTTTQNRLAFSYEVRSAGDTNVAIGGLLTPGTAVTSLDLVGPTPVGSNGRIDGNLPANQTTVSGAVTTGFAWNPGQVLVLNWSDFNDTGNDATLGLDDLTFSATVATFYTPKNLTWAGNSGAWNTVATNWTGDATVYTEAPGPGSSIIADNVTFSSSNAGTVTIRPEGVTPNSVAITGGTYTFAGGPINGSTSVVATGSVNLTLTSSNNFTGGLSVIGDNAVLTVSNDNQLGAAGSALAVAGSFFAPATVVFSGTVTGGRTLSLPTNPSSPLNSLTVDTQANTATFGSLSAGSAGNPIYFEKKGTGSLAFTGSTFVAFGSDFAIRDGSVALLSPSGGSALTISGARSAGQWTGDLVVANNKIVNFGALAGDTTYVSGGGELYFDGPGLTAGTVAFAGVSGIGAQQGNLEVGNDIVVGRGQTTGTRRFYLGANGGFGATPFVNTLTYTGNLTGNTDVGFAYNSIDGGNGVVVLGSALQHTGATWMLLGGNGVVRLGVNNALPAATVLTFGHPTGTGQPGNPGGIGAIDLDGRTLTVGALASTSTPNGTNAPTPTFIGGIVNGSVNAATLVINGTSGGSATYAGGLGSVISSNVATASTNISIILPSTNTLKQILTGSRGTFNYTGTTTVDGGELQFQTPLRPVVGGVPQAAGQVTAGGTGTVTFVGGTSASTNTYAAELSVLSVNGGGAVKVATTDLSTTKSSVLVVNTLAVAGGLIDLGNNDAIFRNTAVGSIRSLIEQAVLSSGNSGLSASSANLFNPAVVGGRNEHAALGWLSPVDQFGFTRFSTFDGLSVSAADVVVKYTYAGDTDLNGILDARDFNAVLNGFSNGLGGWQNGDIDASGVVDATDWTRFLAAYTFYIGGGAPFGESTGPGSAIPEPTALGLLAPAALLLGRRRRA